MCPIFTWIKTYRRYPFIDQPGILPRAQMPEIINAAWKNEVVNRPAAAIEPTL